ncbi:MAG: hypothetical protein ACE5FN_00420 [Leptospirillia bacterium]
MARFGWLPWKFVVRRIARAHGFLDPISILSHLRRFTQPSEVAEPVELLRAGVVLHARGLINSRVIQHNLDWVWPYWVERQFDPEGNAFVPRAFSITHINLTHRNWTAVGLPDVDALPIVDPRGLITPHLDDWSLDAWVVADDGRILLPSRAEHATQRLEMDDDTVRVVTETRLDDLFLSVVAQVNDEDGAPALSMGVNARAAGPAWVVISLRPYNPEGVQFIHRAGLSDDRTRWRVDGETAVDFSEPVERHVASSYAHGDVHARLHDLSDRHDHGCDVGMLTAAALFRVEAGTPRQVTARVPLRLEDGGAPHAVPWARALSGACQLDVPDARFQFLYDAALRSLILHSPGDVYPGPYTYKRFWFRDAAFMVHALLCAGLTGRAERALDRFAPRQKRDGYFHSQDGEWDSNGEALWIMERFCRMTGAPPKAAWRTPIRRGAAWIMGKRLPEDSSGTAGLLPAGFSAEHLGPNDFYYWDDFWGVAGLAAAARMHDALGDVSGAARWRDGAEALSGSIDRSLARAAERLGRPAMPAAPGRRLDAGAIGSIAAGYPLQLFPADDARLLDLADYLLDDCFVRGGFFQDMIHSGINPYLTLHIAQVLLRAGDPRYLDLVERMAEMASPTGQWPEAIHPRTGGGCMGDGQHVWAAAEWLIMVRNLFVREEDDALIIASGVPPRWLEAGEPLWFGPAPTLFGPVTVSIERHDSGARVVWQGAWHGAAPRVEIRLPGCVPVVADPDAREALLERETVT